MKKRHKCQYTVRDVPESTNARLREVAAEQDISLNQATLQALERGLGQQGTVPYRHLRELVSPKQEIDRAAWDQTLSEIDQVHPDDWK